MSDDNEVADIGMHALVRRLQSMPREIPPQRSVWPEIEALISKVPQEKPQRPWQQRLVPFALAASLLMAISALSLSVYTNLKVPAATPVALAAQTPNALDAIDQGFTPARLAYLHDLATRESQLDPETRALLLQNLQVIEAATAQIRTALDEHPGDPLLLDALELVNRNELEILEQLAAPRANMI